MSKEIYQFKIDLKDIKPKIWRRVLVPSSFTLKKLHAVIQECFGWGDCHLYAFDIFGEQYDDEIPRSLTMKLNKLNLAVKKKFTYLYDFGDSWEHNIVLENILPDDGSKNFPYCVAGECAAPPEDCGGPPGYEHLLEVICDQNHEDHEEMMEWLGESFVPELCDIKKMNEQLSYLRK